MYNLVTKILFRNSHIESTPFRMFFKTSLVIIRTYPADARRQEVVFDVVSTFIQRRSSVGWTFITNEKNEND